MPGRTDYEERKQARIDRLSASAEKARNASADASQWSHDLVKDIPFGQPNIVGRSVLPSMRKKSMNLMEKSVALDEKASHYEEKAEAAMNNKAISSDDPDAIAKLKEKIAKLEAERERIKAFNKEARKNGTEPAPWYALQYISKDIKAAKDRIAKLEAVDKMPAKIVRFDDGEIESDPATNRVIIRFDERQDHDVISRLKANGFKWSPSVGAWQRLRNPAALRTAYKLCNVAPESEGD